MSIKNHWADKKKCGLCHNMFDNKELYREGDEFYCIECSTKIYQEVQKRKMFWNYEIPKEEECPIQ